MKKKVTAIFLLLNIIYIKLSAETYLKILGKKTSHAVVFTASLDSEGNETDSARLLKKLSGHFENHTPPMTVIIAITPIDISDLPGNIPIKKHSNTKNIIQSLNEYSSPLVFLIEDGNKENVEIIAGAERITSPAWLFSDLYNLCKKENINIDFNFHNFPLYRIGIVNRDPILGEYLKTEIPAIKLKTDIDITNIIISIPEIYKQGIPAQWDKHYLAKNIFGRVHIIQEKVLVYIIIAIITIGFLLLFTLNFPFAFGKTKDSNLSSYLTLWIIPFVFFIIIFISLFISTKITALLFFVKFNNFNSVNFLPLTASFSKFLIALLFIFLFSTLNNTLNIRPTQFICGYMSNLICLINIFVFSYADFSLSLLFLEMYVISFFAHRIKNIFIQLIFSVIIITPMIPYIVISFYNSKELLDLFFKGSNLILSMGLLPIILLYNKLLLKSASKKTEKNIKKVIIPAAVLVIGLIISSVLIFTIPAWTKNNPMEIIVYQKVYENTVSTKIEAPIKLSNNIKAVLRNPPDINSKNFFTDAFKKTDISFVEYSERKIAEIITLSKLNNKAIEIKIKSDNAFPVYESNLEFERENDKKTVGFIFPQNPPNPLLLSFTSDKNANLDITIKHWSYENPFNTEIENLNLKNVSIKFIMEIQESFKLSNGDLSK